MQDEIQYLKNIYKDFNKQIPNDKELIFRINKTKNDLKHNDSGENQWISNDYENEAALLFVKAVKNYFACYEALPKDRIIKNLFLQLTL